MIEENKETKNVAEDFDTEVELNDVEDVAEETFSEDLPSNESLQAIDSFEMSVEELEAISDRVIQKKDQTQEKALRFIQGKRIDVLEKMNKDVPVYHFSGASGVMITKRFSSSAPKIEMEDMLKKNPPAWKLLTESVTPERVKKTAYVADHSVLGKIYFIVLYTLPESKKDKED